MPAHRTAVKSALDVFYAIGHTARMSNENEAPAPPGEALSEPMELDLDGEMCWCIVADTGVPLAWYFGQWRMVAPNLARIIVASALRAERAAREKAEAALLPTRGDAINKAASLGAEAVRLRDQAERMPQKSAEQFEARERAMDKADAAKKKADEAWHKVREMAEVRP